MAEMFIFCFLHRRYFLSIKNTGKIKMSESFKKLVTTQLYNSGSRSSNRTEDIMFSGCPSICACVRAWAEALRRVLVVSVPTHAVVRTGSEVLSVDGAVNGSTTSTVCISTDQARVILPACRTHHSVAAHLLVTYTHLPVNRCSHAMSSCVAAAFTPLSHDVTARRRTFHCVFLRCLAFRCGAESGLTRFGITGLRLG